MTRLQSYKAEIRWQQFLTVKRLAAELRLAMLNCDDDSAIEDLTNALVNINKALRKLKA